MNREILKYALWLLNRRDYPERGIREKLIRKFGEEKRGEIETVITYLKEKHFLDDARYTENYVYFKLKKGYGKKRVEHELKNKGIDDRLIRGVIDGACEQAEDVFLKKLKQLEGKKRKRVKLYQFMIRRGFESEKIIELLNKYEVKDDEDS